MPSQYKKQPTELELAKAIWYKKLEESGFVDIEQDEDNLKSWSAKFATKKSQELWKAKESYYHMATHFLNDYKFETPIEKIIWEYHAEAISVQDISRILRKLRYRKLGQRSKIDHNSVWAVISKLEKIMKNMYLPSQTEENG